MSISLQVLGIIPARKGSRGLPGKNIRDLLGKPVIAYTIEAALAAQRLDAVLVTSDDEQVEKICRSYNVTFIDRPPDLAGDTAPIDRALRHACRQWISRGHSAPDLVVLLYANIPVRAEGVIDRAIDHLADSGADSVQTMAPVGKFHPYWLYQLNQDRAAKYIDNNIYQRQKLPPLYSIDGAVAVVRYDTLMAAADSEDPHAFWGSDKRALVQPDHETIDIDSAGDFYRAEAALRDKQGRFNNENIAAIHPEKQNEL